MHPNCEPVGRPYRIISVRGPRTREWLVNHGIECPETYGDPALLLPLFYQPVIHRGSAPLAIPHYKSLPKAMPMLDDITKRGFKLLDMGNYGTWTEIIDSICNSEFIISESLHGIIVAEAYGIPCIWVEFQEHFPDWTFKYNDFYESIGRYEEEPIRVYKVANYENIIFDKLKQWKCANIDLEEMMKYFPFV